MYGLEYFQNTFVLKLDHSFLLLNLKIYFFLLNRILISGWEQFHALNSFSQGKLFSN